MRRSLRGHTVTELLIVLFMLLILATILLAFRTPAFGATTQAIVNVH